MHNYEVCRGVWSIKRRRSNFSLCDNEEQLRDKSRQWQSDGLTHGLVALISEGRRRILDVACGEGLYSFIAGAQAAYVLGIDIDRIRIEKAGYVKKIAEKDNVEFRELNLYSEDFDRLEHFDVAFCLGLLHRVPDPFNLVNKVASKSDLVLFEWISAPAIIDQDTPWAYHGPGGLYEWMNATDNFEAPEIAGQGRAGGGVNRAAYWLMSYGALEVLCARAGLNHFVRLSRRPHYPDLSDTPAELSRRVALVAGRAPFEFLGRQSRAGLNAATVKHYQITDKR